MQRETLIFVGVCDLAGHVRGKGFPASELEPRLRKGIGLTGANITMSAFGPIHVSPFGTEGDLMLAPDPSAEAAEQATEDAAIMEAEPNDVEGPQNRVAETE